MNRSPSSSPRLRWEQILSQSKQNENDQILFFNAPGIKHPIGVPFQYGKLPVCAVCKESYKTRHGCRAQDKHTSVPWTTVYVCITLDSTCTNEEGIIYSDKIFVGQRISARQYRFKQKKGEETPICATCKERNYTRYYCREKRKNRNLPWKTTFVVLSAYEKDLSPKKESSDKKMVGQNKYVSELKTPSDFAFSSSREGLKREKQKDNRKEVHTPIVSEKNVDVYEELKTEKKLDLKEEEAELSVSKNVLRKSNDIYKSVRNEISDDDVGKGEVTAKKSLLSKLTTDECNIWVTPKEGVKVVGNESSNSQDYEKNYFLQQITKIKKSDSVDGEYDDKKSKLKDRRHEEWGTKSKVEDTKDGYAIKLVGSTGDSKSGELTEVANNSKRKCDDITFGNEITVNEASGSLPHKPIGLIKQETIVEDESVIQSHLTKRSSDIDYSSSPHRMGNIMFGNETTMDEALVSQTQKRIALNEKKETIEGEPALQSQATKRSADVNSSSSPPQKLRLDNSGDGKEAKQLDFFEKIDNSRTFIALLSSKSCSFEWLEIGCDPEPSRTKSPVLSPTKKNDNESVPHEYYHHPQSYPIPDAYYPPQYYSHSQWEGYDFPPVQSQTIPQTQRGHANVPHSQQYQHHESHFQSTPSGYNSSYFQPPPTQHQERNSQGYQYQLSPRHSTVSSQQQPFSHSPPSVMPHNQYPMQQLSHDRGFQNELINQQTRRHHNPNDFKGLTNTVTQPNDKKPDQDTMDSTAEPLDYEPQQLPPFAAYPQPRHSPIKRRDWKRGK